MVAIELKLTLREYRILIVGLGVALGAVARMREITGEDAELGAELDELQEKILGTAPRLQPQMMAVS